MQVENTPGFFGLFLSTLLHHPNHSPSSLSEEEEFSLCGYEKVTEKALFNKCGVV